MRPCALLGLLLLSSPTLAQTKDFNVASPTRLDWAFAVRGFGKDAATLPARFDSTKVKYQLYVPMKRDSSKAMPLIAFISPGNQPAGWANWKKICERGGLIFCSPYGAGNDVPAGQRTRIVLDMIDDVRRKHAIDPHQTYLSGFSGGGRMACAIGFSLPEMFAGIVPICGTNPVTAPTYLRHRHIDRVSVAFVTGERDFNRKENEAFMGPFFEELGIRSKLWVVPGLGHGIPTADQLDSVYAWLKEDLPRRLADAKNRPLLAAKSNEAPDAPEQASRMFQAAQDELRDPRRAWHGVSLLQGIVARWGNTEMGLAARQALKKILADERLLDAIGDQGVADEQKFLSAQAKGLERFGDFARAAQAWEILSQNYGESPIGRDAREHVRRLRLLGKGK